MELRFPVLLDGATGTELQKMGFDTEDCTEKWVLEHTNTIIRIQKGYVEEGSDVIYSPTFGANQTKLEQHHIFGQVRTYNEKLTALSKEAADGKALVAGDIAPTGQMLYPFGPVRFEELVEIYQEQVESLEKAGADLYVIETMMTVSDARAALLAVKSVSTKPVFVSFTCDEKGRTLTGSDITAVLQIIQGMGADAFGMNCSVGPDMMLRQEKRLHQISRIPLIAKPNAGLPEFHDGKAVYPCTPEEFASYIPRLAEVGVEIFGGCCGSTKEHIAAMHEALKKVTMVPPSPAEEYQDKLPCATEKEAFFLDPSVQYGKVLPCSADLEDDLEEENDSPDPVTAIRIESERELPYFEDAQALIRKPLCLVSEDTVLLERALRLYQGRAMYDGNLKEKELSPLVQKYGLII